MCYNLEVDLLVCGLIFAVSVFIIIIIVVIINFNIIIIMLYLLVLAQLGTTEER